MLKVTKSAKSIEEAIELAATALGVETDQVSYSVIRESKGLMKLFTGAEVEISAWKKSDDEKVRKAEEKTTKSEKPAKAEKPETEAKDLDITQNDTEDKK